MSDTRPAASLGDQAAAAALFQPMKLEFEKLAHPAMRYRFKSTMYRSREPPTHVNRL